MKCPTFYILLFFANKTVFRHYFKSNNSAIFVQDGRLEITARYTAHLVYRNSRPNPPTAKPAFTVKSEVGRNEALGRWLNNHQMTVQEFTNFVCGPQQSSDIGGLPSNPAGLQSDLDGSAPVSPDSSLWEKAMEDKYREFVSSIEVPNNTQVKIGVIHQF